jgi:hypothetical protein
MVGTNLALEMEQQLNVSHFDLEPRMNTDAHGSSEHEARVIIRVHPCSSVATAFGEACAMHASSV